MLRPKINEFDKTEKNLQKKYLKKFTLLIKKLRVWFKDLKKYSLKIHGFNRTWKKLQKIKSLILEPEKYSFKKFTSWIKLEVVSKTKNHESKRI